jgi:hypothetical protein
LPSGTSIKEAGVGICDQPGNGWTVVLRRRPARIVEGQPEGGYTGAFEIICCYCGDHPYLDYREVPPEFQRIRGPYPIAAGVAAYEEHLGLHQSRQTVHEPSSRHTGVNAADPRSSPPSERPEPRRPAQGPDGGSGNM